MNQSTTKFRSRTGKRPEAGADAAPANTRARRRPDTPPQAVAPFRATQETELEKLKQRLLAELLAETSARPDLNLAYRRAANEAVSLAWLTPFPLLVLPALLGERAAETRERADRQRDVLLRTAKCKAAA